jgi:acyl-coenzyme A thioesterase PaaI-like protein
VQNSLQDTYAPHSSCFGCGPMNVMGLRIKSFPSGDDVLCEWTPEPYHASFAGALSGGIVSTLLDCHSNWTAAYALMVSRKGKAPPGTVTAKLNVEFLRPTPMGKKLDVRARATRIEGDRVNVEATVEEGGKITARSEGVFVSVREGHPAFHRWE